MIFPSPLHNLTFFPNRLDKELYTSLLRYEGRIINNDGSIEGYITTGSKFVYKFAKNIS